jgi:hypothetical protein
MLRQWSIWSLLRYRSSVAPPVFCAARPVPPESALQLPPSAALYGSAAGARLWFASIASMWSDVFLRYHLVPAWRPGSDLPVALPNSLSSPAMAADIARCNASEDSGEGTIPVKCRREWIVRQVVWAHELPEWRARMQALRRLSTTGWELLLPGPLPQSTACWESSTFGSLMQRMLRFGCLPVSKEYNRVNEQCPPVCQFCSRLVIEDAHHFLFYCPTFSKCRRRVLRVVSGVLRRSPVLVDAAHGRMGRALQMAMFCDAGAPGWPVSNPVPAYAATSELPVLSSLLSKLPGGVRVSVRRSVCTFLVKIWSRRRFLIKSGSLVLVPPSVEWQPSTLYDSDAFTSSLLRRPVYG